MSRIWDAAVIVGAWQRVRKIDQPLGVRLPFQGGAIARVAQTGRTARSTWTLSPPLFGERMLAAERELGGRARSWCRGRLWGHLISNGNGRSLSSRHRGALSRSSRALVAVALANAEARES